jgi:glycosyltransferase involved in cell wall biosynthesis
VIQEYHFANMKKMLLLGPSLSAVSGVSTHLNQLFNSSLAVEYQLIHFQVGSEGRRESTVQKIQRFLLSPFFLAAKIIAVSPDIVHLNTSLDQKAFWRDVVYLLVAKMFGKLVVYQVHGGDLPQDFLGGNPILTSFLRRLLSWPDAVVLLASVEREAYQQFSQFKRLLVIPNAIDLGDYSNQGGKQFGSGKVKLGYIGRLAHNKGISEAIEAINILLKTGTKNITLTIAGSGPAESDLRAQVKSQGLEQDVIFAGALFGEQKNNFWRQTDFFVFPTYHREGLRYTVLESFSSGTPMITTRVGGIGDVVRDGIHGFFVEPHDPAGVAAAIKSMIEDNGWTQKMSIECVARAREFYGVDRLARQFSELYKSLLNC